MHEAAVTCEHITKSFGATRAVRDVTFSLRPGEVLALVGENGAGKSTLMNLVAGVMHPDEGTVAIARPAGQLVRPVAMVHQELSLFGNLTVAENLEIDRRSGGVVVSEQASRERSRAIVRDLGIEIDVDSTVADLSPGQRQLVEVAKAISAPPTVLILDEPTSSLEGPQVELLFAAVRRLAERGSAVVFVSHRMDENFALCDRVLVMRDGAQVTFGDLTDHTRDSLVEPDGGPGNRPPLSRARRGGPRRGPRDGAARRVRRHAPHRCDDDRPGGGGHGRRGTEGHGQSVLAEVLAGALRPRSGHVLVGGSQVRLTSPRAAVRRGIGYIPPTAGSRGCCLRSRCRPTLSSPRRDGSSRKVWSPRASNDAPRVTC